MKTRAHQIAIVAIILFISFFCFPVQKIYAQTTVSLCVDLSVMIDSGYYKPGEDKIVLRGSFNNWSGMDFMLLPDDGKKGNYCGLFVLDSPPEGKIEYKYTIVTPDGREYWEEKPNPDNPEYGNRVLVMEGSEMSLPVAYFNYGKEIRGRVMSPDQQLRADFLQARKLLEDNHPALYDYTPKEDLDELFEKYYSEINEETEETDLYHSLSLILAKVGCGHTKLWLPEAFWLQFPDRFFPLQMIFSDQDVLVKGHYGLEDTIPAGAEVLTINGVPMDKILDDLLAFESADGFIESFKYHSLDQRFPLKYALIYGFPETFHITYRAPGEMGSQKVELLPASLSMVESVPVRGNELSLRETEGKKAAIITINNFSYYAEVPMFRAFIDSSFLVLKEKDINNLIIDLRGNDGGDPWCASYLFSYLEKEPVPYFIEAYHHYEDLAKPLPLPENHYSGNVYVLIDGGCFSTTGHLLGLLKYHKLVKFVGTVSGATYTCTGNVMYVPLENTGLILGTARESRYTTAVQDMDPRQGIIPDYIRPVTADDLAEGVDGQMKFVLELAGE